MTKPPWLDTVHSLVENFNNRLNITKPKHQYLYKESNTSNIFYSKSSIEDVFVEHNKKLYILIDHEDKLPTGFYEFATQLARLETDIVAITPTDLDIRVTTKAIYYETEE